MKKTKVGTVIPNSDQKLPNGRYSKKTRKSFKKYYCLQGVPEKQSFKKYDFMIKMIVFLLQFLRYKFNATFNSTCSTPNTESKEQQSNKDSTQIQSTACN